MENHSPELRSLPLFAEHLRREERAEGTVEKYVHDAELFVRWLAGRELSKERLTAYKELLAASGRRPATINGILAALHSFLLFLGREDCRVKYLKLQRRLFRARERELTKEEYARLVSTARAQGRERLALVMECIGGTGLRVSELKFITLEALRRGRAEVALKGKIRTILIPGKLCRKLLGYARKQKIAAGEIFLTGSGKPLSRGQVWAEMKSLCRAAGVDESKVFPHNLRHLFARVFYKSCRDIVLLADVLGHSSLSTTRIYLLSTGAEHARQIERLGLVS